MDQFSLRIKSRKRDLFLSDFVLVLMIVTWGQFLGGVILRSAYTAKWSDMSVSITPADVIMFESLMMMLSMHEEDDCETLVGMVIKKSKLLECMALMKS